MLKVINPPSELPVTLEQAKSQCVVEHTNDDALIEDLHLPAAVEMAQTYMERPIMQQTVVLQLDTFPTGDIELDTRPITSVAVKYDDTDGNEQTLETSLYKVNKHDLVGILRPVDAWPDTADGFAVVRIEIVVGIADAGDVPAQIKQGILYHVSEMYHDRAQGESSIPKISMVLYDTQSVKSF